MFALQIIRWLELQIYGAYDQRLQGRILPQGCLFVFGDFEVHRFCLRFIDTDTKVIAKESAIAALIHVCLTQEISRKIRTMVDLMIALYVVFTSLRSSFQ